MSCLPLGMYTRRTGAGLYMAVLSSDGYHDIHIKIDLKLLNTYPVKTSFAFILLYVFESSIKVFRLNTLSLNE
ncbi:MAG: hypothetical protein HS127_15785 [Planctomycetia bacterium]|nr:hypothetical protein [Planctomycetia bacterium]